MRIDDNLQRYGSIEQAQERFKPQQPSGTSKKAAFDEILSGELSKREQITFSKHAEQRLTQRGIELSDQDMERLDAAARLAEKKGVRNTLVLMDQNAFIVNIPSNTVITAIDGENAKFNIFTQIDGAVIV